MKPGQLGVGSRENAWRPQEVKGLLSKKIVQIAAGCYHTLALDDAGYAYAAGRNNHCQLARDKGKADSHKFLRVAGLQVGDCEITAGAICHRRCGGRR